MQAAVLARCPDAPPTGADRPHLCKQAVMPSLHIAIALMAIGRGCLELDAQVSGDVFTELDERCFVVRLDGGLCKVICCNPAFGLIKGCA